MKDEEIIEHLKNNRYPKAVKGLYGILPSIKKYVIANSGTNEDADDIFQDALVILYKKIHQNEFTLSVSLSTFLYAVSKNCWLQELRRRKKMPLAESENDIAQPETNEEIAFKKAAASFSLLGEKCRQLLILFYYKKQSFKEIAAALSFSDEKVAKNQKYRCLQKAKENYVTLSKTNLYE